MIEKAKKKKKKSGVLITRPLGHCLGPFHCQFPCTVPSPAFHCAALLSTDDSPTWRVCKVFILPGIFSSFHGRHSINICYLPKKNASAWKESLYWKMKPDSKSLKATFGNATYLYTGNCLPWPWSLPGLCLSHVCICVSFPVLGAHRVDDVTLTSGPEQRLAYNRHVTELICEKNQGIKKINSHLRPASHQHGYGSACLSF